jgi:hypothetical protein
VLEVVIAQVAQWVAILALIGALVTGVGSIVTIISAALGLLLV